MAAAMLASPKTEDDAAMLMKLMMSANEPPEAVAATASALPLHSKSAVVAATLTEAARSTSVRAGAVGGGVSGGVGPSSLGGGALKSSHRKVKGKTRPRLKVGSPPLPPPPTSLPLLSPSLSPRCD